MMMTAVESLATPAARHQASSAETSCGRPLRVVQINTWLQVGGAARVAQRLHRALRWLGYDARLLAGFGPTQPQDGTRAVLSAWPRWKHVLRRVTLGMEDVTGLQYLLAWWSSDLVDHPWVQAADVVHLHNTHGGYLSPASLPRLTARHAVVWTLHDMWPLTGHCAYSMECERWRTGCGHCPHLDTYPDLWHDQTAMLWRIKQRLYAACQLTIVTPSAWLASAVRQSPLLGQFSVHHIPNGVDLDLYRSHPQSEAREALGLPVDRPLVLFIGEALDDPRKGGGILADAMGRLPADIRERLLLVTVGQGVEQLPWPGQLRRISLGPVSEENLLPLIYSSADLVVCPSQLDNLPNTLVEAAACGAPAVACAVGGIPEVVQHMETGYLARPSDPADVAHGMTVLLSDAALRQHMSHRSRELAQERYSLQRQVQRYAALYEGLAAERPGVRSEARR